MVVAAAREHPATISPGWLLYSVAAAVVTQSILYLHVPAPPTPRADAVHPLRKKLWIEIFPLHTSTLTSDASWDLLKKVFLN